MNPTNPTRTWPEFWPWGSTRFGTLRTQPDPKTGWDSFHLCLFDFPFIYQFHFLMTTLVKSAFWNPADLLIFKSFQQHFSIISKFVCCGFYIKKDVGFTLISFALLKWDECLSVQLPFELPVEIPVQLHLELEVNWLVQNVNELEFELSRM